MKVTFIYHSAFLVELERCSLLFDWHGGDLPKIDCSSSISTTTSVTITETTIPRKFFLDLEWTMSGISWPPVFACPPNEKLTLAFRRIMYFVCQLVLPLR